jgi:hypothetical protein
MESLKNQIISQLSLENLKASQDKYSESHHGSRKATPRKVHPNLDRMHPAILDRKSLPLKLQEHLGNYLNE